MSDLVIETHNLSKRYGAQVIAVDNMSMMVRRGEIYGFVGPNGAGKTTTLKMLLGLVRPSAGVARVAGAAPGTTATSQRVGALVELPAFYPYLSGRDNLRVMAKYAGASIARVETVLDDVDLSKHAQRKFKTYSLGMKQRLGIAAALLKEPELLILDEPTNGLDPQGMADMRALIRSVCQQNRTVVLSSHLLGEVEHVCDRVGIIKQGKLVAEGRVADLRGQGALLVRAQPIDQAQQVLQRVLGHAQVRVVDGTLRLTTDMEHIGEVSRALVVAGVDLLELRPIQQSLEDVFLDLTHQKEVAS